MDTKLLFSALLLLLIINELSALEMLGADISSLKRAQEYGQKYYNSKGQVEDPIDILKSVGVNYIRLRIWNNPKNGDNNKAYVLAFAKTIKAKNLKLMIDFHYSDTWADPKNQYKPEQWKNHNMNQLPKDVYDYTYDVCHSLKAQNTPPDSVEIGNEIDNGFLWPEGKLETNFHNVGVLLKSGIKAIRDCNKDTKIVIHSSAESNLQKHHWFYDGIKKEGVDWDITGLSYYCMWSGLPSQLPHVVTDLKQRYNKPVLIAETAHPYKLENAWHQKTDVSMCPGYNASFAGQANNLHDMIKAGSDSIGVFYWEPTWVASPHMGDVDWDANAVFDDKGHINPLIKWW